MRKIILFYKRNRLKLILNFKLFAGIKTSTFKLKSGEKFRIRNIDLLGFELINEESFEENTKNLIMNTVKCGMVVLDIGANIGYYTVKMASIVGEQGKVLAFEPNSLMVEELKNNIELNNFKNIQIHEIALSNISGNLTFYNPSIGKEAHGSLKQNKTFDFTDTKEVKAERLDMVLKNAGIDKVDFIKMDVEGAEYEVLLGAKELLSSDNKPIIIFESAENLCYAFEHKVFDVLKLVSDYGYEIENIDFGNWIARPKKNDVLDIIR